MNTIILAVLAALGGLTGARVKDILEGAKSRLPGDADDKAILDAFVEDALEEVRAVLGEAMPSVDAVKTILRGVGLELLSPAPGRDPADWRDS